MNRNSDLESSIRAAAEIILKAKYTVALTGAGVSVESGIRPFRGPGGLWTERGEPPMDGYQRFQQDPKEYWVRRLDPQRMRGFGKAILESKPNPGHIALTDLERMGILKSLITQNIDNLHIAAGNSNVIEIHGNVKKLRCIACGTRFPLEGFEFTELPPKCKICEGIVKSDTVMFGEPVPIDVLNRCQREAELSDCILIIGTSATVIPAASLPLTVKRRGGTLIEINPHVSELTWMCDVSIRAPSGEALPLLVSELKKKEQHKRN